MKISELMDELIKLYPRQFSDQDVVDHWAKFYKMALPEGPNLQTAFEETMIRWTKPTFPRPGDFRQHWPEAKAETDDEVSGWSERALWKWVVERREGEAGEIWREAVERAVGRCAACTHQSYADCRCQGWQLAWENAGLWLQREFHIDQGRSRINPYPRELTNAQILEVQTARRAPPMKVPKGFRRLADPIRGHVQDSSIGENN